MATYNALAATTLEGKILGIWFPIMVFVSCSFEHSVANAYFIPLGMLYGANVTMYDFIVKNLIPATLGNIIGGAFIIGCLFYYVNDYRNRHNRFIFNFIEKIWKYLKKSNLLSNTRFNSMNDNDNLTTTTNNADADDEYDEEEDLKSDLDFLEVKNKQQDVI
ncbi:predicted protein [Naegleria gruberi]|uniref:Predicted protein n=1 Tax=Naegleria gruberi TaxID=5762 RepID=D2W5N2_NAEGR|nr:uncharacterized protein NAEGRDRAFT_76723 [Naegleria gruberi]EFC35619.1 predicted protein [Naegleria gruberi]|eukprot:XP_002668363.1 predicted protein [Naegleria gruberi strain NEG-M]